MSVIVKETGGQTFPPHPEGQFPARCIDVWDVGIVETQYGKKHRVCVRFYCGQFHKIEGDLHPAFLDCYFNATLNEKSSLRAFLENWRGRVFTKDELDGFDLDNLVGAPALLQVVHKQGEKKTYANVKVVMKLPGGMTAPDGAPNYVRIKDRPTEGEESPDEPNYTVSEEEDDLPF